MFTPTTLTSSQTGETLNLYQTPDGKYSSNQEYYTTGGLPNSIINFDANIWSNPTAPAPTTTATPSPAPTTTPTTTTAPTTTTTPTTSTPVPTSTNPDIQNAMNQVSELEKAIASDPQIAQWREQIANGTGTINTQRNIDAKLQSYQTDLQVWKTKLASLQQHEVANSPEASALFNTDKVAYMQKYGSPQDIANITANPTTGLPAPAPQGQPLGQPLTAVQPAEGLMQNLQLGSTGDAVKQLQSILGITADGIFGPKTLQAVKTYQQTHGLTVDGIVGPKTMAAMGLQNSGKSVADAVDAGIKSGISSSTGANTGTTGATPTKSKSGLTYTGDPTIDSAIDLLDKQSPQTNFSQIYKQIYEDLGLSNIKKEYEKYSKEYTDLQNEKTDKQVEINDNPWYSEGKRVNELRKLDQKYELRENNLLNKIKMAETMYENGRQDAQFVAGQTMEQLNQSAKLNQDLIMKAIDIAEAQAKAESGLTGPSSVQEYKYAVSQGYKGSFTQYQNEDANRKMSIARAGVGSSGLSSKEYTALNQITTRFQADPIINLAVKGSTAVAIADQIIANPSSATNQLKSLYVLVKNLDPDSAVREGELALANQTQSYLQQFGNTLARITEGRVVSPDAALALAKATKELMLAWNSTAQKREQQYTSQASTLNIGDEFGSYISGSNLGYNQPTTTGSKFDYLQDQITIRGTNSYLPRSVWNTIQGADRDALLAEAKADGYPLLITD